MSADTFWERYGHFVGCTVRESNSAVGIVTGVSNENGPQLHIRRRNGKIDRRKPSDVHKTCACGKRALDSNGKVCPGHENCKPLACAPPEPEDCQEPHEDGPLNYCPTCSWSRKPPQMTEATYRDDRMIEISRHYPGWLVFYRDVDGASGYVIAPSLEEAAKQMQIWLTA